MVLELLHVVEIHGKIFANFYCKYTEGVKCKRGLQYHVLQWSEETKYHIHMNMINSGTAKMILQNQDSSHQLCEYQSCS